MTMLLEGKTAVVYGAGGAVGSAVARAFAREGARVVLTGPTQAKLDAVAEGITRAGGTAETARLDALDEQAVDRHAGTVAQATGIDVSFNALGIDNGEQWKPLVEMSTDEYLAPTSTYLRTQFVTARAAARHMIEQRSGVILPLSNPLGRMPAPHSGSFGQAMAAIENLARQLAAELGPHGIRVVCLRPTGMPGTVELGSHTGQIWRRAAENLGLPFEQLLQAIGSGTARERPLDVEELAEVAAFMAADRASGLTATVANVTAGAIVD